MFTPSPKRAKRRHPNHKRATNTHEQASDTEPTIEPMVLETSDTEKPPPPPPPPQPETKSEEGEQSSPARKPKQLLNMPTTPKILQQVECQACSKQMCAKNLKYSHAKYCTAREREEQPEDIPIPKMEIKNDAQIKNKESLPVKKHKLKRTQTTTYKQEAEDKATAPPSTPRLPEQTPEMDQSYLYKRHQRIQMKNEKMPSYDVQRILN